MQRCNWCNNPINNGPFSNYCSKKCEKEAVSNGERRGVKSSFSAVFIVIFIIMIGFYAVKKNGNKSQETTESAVEQNNFSPTDNSNAETYETSQQNNVSSDEINSQNELTQENVSSDTTKVQNSEEEFQPENNKDEIVIRLLNEGRSVKEVAEATGLSKQEVRKIRRNAE